MAILEAVSVVSGAATAIAVIVAAWQLYLTKRHAITAFEDSLGREYRELASRLPTKVLLGEPLNAREYAQCFDELYHYNDLFNEQDFLRKVGRVSDRTWEF